jgi:hypothetical protein
MLKSASVNKACGTSLQGYITTDYATLVKVFGEPTTNDGYKTDAEWVLTDGDVVATIYNYKTGRNYLGEEGIPTESIKDWHIGGKSYRAAELVREALAQVKP